MCGVWWRAALRLLQRPSLRLPAGSALPGDLASRVLPNTALPAPDAGCTTTSGTGLRPSVQGVRLRCYRGGRAVAAREREREADDAVGDQGVPEVALQPRDL